MHHRQGPGANRLRASQAGRQAVVVVDLPLREFLQHVQAAETLQLLHEVVAEITEEALRLAARLFRAGTRFLSFALGMAGSLETEVSEHCGDDSCNGQNCATERNLPGPEQRFASGELTIPLLGQQTFRRFARLTFLALVAAGFDHAAQHIVRQLDAAHIQPFFDSQQTPVDQQRKRPRRGAGGREAAQQTLLGHVLAKTRRGQEVVFYDAAYGGGLVRQRALIEVGQDAGMRAGQQVEGNLAAASPDPCVVQLTADQTQQ